MTEHARASRFLAPHAGAALEYWFFKVNGGRSALLVDWIERRGGGATERTLRASIHSPFGRQVRFEHGGDFDSVRAGLAAGVTSGRAGSVEWDLRFDPAEDWISPDTFPARALRMTDMAIVSAPRIRFSGEIVHGTHRAHLDGAPGMLSHYWGRRLPADWWWISANQFDRDDVSVECMVVRSSLWGSPVTLTVAYLELRYGDGRISLMSPPARAAVSGTPERFVATVRPLFGDPITLAAVGREYGDLGDGIVNTLVGDLEVRVGDRMIGRAAGTAGLERRAASATRR